MFNAVARPRTPNLGYLAVGMRKQVSASRRRPGNFTANHQPSTTAAQAGTWYAHNKGKRARAYGLKFDVDLPSANRQA